MKKDVPENTLKSLLAYRDERRPCGGFLSSVLSNNLAASVMAADAANKAALPEIVQWVYWELPSAAWGSPEKVAAWTQPKEVHHG